MNREVREGPGIQFLKFWSKSDGGTPPKGNNRGTISIILIPGLLNSRGESLNNTNMKASTLVALAMTVTTRMEMLRKRRNEVMAEVSGTLSSDLEHDPRRLSGRLLVAAQLQEHIEDLEISVRDHFQAAHSPETLWKFLGHPLR